MNSNSKNPNDKGLGWIPDYPDLRDYRLGSGDINDPVTGRLKREEGSKEIEKITEEFTSLLVESFASLLDDITFSANIGKSKNVMNFLNKEANKLKTKVDNQVNELQLAILGDISFESVNIYRQLRQGVKPKTPFHPPNEFLYESDVAKRIIELKSCLYFIFRTEQLPENKLDNSSEPNNIEEKIIKTRENLKALKNPGKTLKWMKEESFDDQTSLLVQLFQYCADIWIDGIVGLETYTTLNQYLEYLSDPKIFSTPERFINFDSRFKDFFDPQKYSLYPSSEYQPKLCLLPVSLPLPKEVFRAFLCQLVRWSTDETHQKNDEDIYEKNHLKKINVENKDAFEKLIKEGSNSSQNDRQRIQEVSKILFETKDGGVNDGIEKFMYVVQKEFHLVEPIVAVVIKILIPLAKFRNDSWESIISNGLAKFEKLLESSKTNTSQRTITKEFAVQALRQVEIIFDSEITFKIKDTNWEVANSDSRVVLYFYFLIIKLVRRFTPRTDLEKTDGLDTSSLNPFEKQEVFEITKTRSSSQMNFFKITNLQIPLRRTFLESFGLNRAISTNSSSIDRHNLSKVKQYLFLPSVVDLSYWCSEIEDQGALNTCTALAGVALLEYFMNRSNGRYTDASSLFLYKATRDLMNLNGDVGASVRETMKAMALFGVPPEKYWQYDEAKVDEEPPSFCYSFAQNYQALKYFRLDYAGISKEVLLVQIKAVIATSFPCVFGFTIYTSAYEVANQRNGLIPFPNYKRDQVVGGHSVVAVGYDDYKKIEREDRFEPSEGAFLIRNSFGDKWGDRGYGWLPYDYVLAGLTADWWSLLKAEWFSDDFWQGVRGSQGPDITSRQP